MIKNNLLYDAYSGDYNVNQVKDNVITDNWLDADGDPLFVDPDVSDPMSLTLPDLSLQSGSTAIDSGTYLTQTNGSGSDSTTLVVDDALYFQDGSWGAAISNIQGDWIAIGTVDNVVQVDTVDYTTNTILLNAPMTWSDAAPVWLYRNSSGRTVLVGPAPDVGAHEYGAVPDVDGGVDGSVDTDGQVSADAASDAGAPSDAAGGSGDAGPADTSPRGCGCRAADSAAVWGQLFLALLVLLSLCIRRVLRVGRVGSFIHRA